MTHKTKRRSPSEASLTALVWLEKDYLTASVGERLELAGGSDGLLYASLRGEYGRTLGSMDFATSFVLQDYYRINDFELRVLEEVACFGCRCLVVGITSKDGSEVPPVAEEDAEGLRSRLKAAEERRAAERKGGLFGWMESV
ncbi:MAG: hypothetical protein JXR33_04380 [Coriobacteriia bacterium]|nr:hypothetical protein [Coriobacteriia bacterium]